MVPVRLAHVPAPLTRVERRQLLGFFLLVLAVLGLTAGGHAYSIDDEIMFQTTRSLVHLDRELSTVDPNNTQLYHHRDDGGVTGIYGLGQSLAAVPLYVVSSAAARVVPPEGREVLVRTTTFLTNSIMTALIAVTLVLAARWYSSSFRRALGLGAAYAFGTYAWPHAKTFFSEPGTALCVLFAVLACVAWNRTGEPRWAAAIGAASVTALLFRTSAGAFLPVFALFVGWKGLIRGGPRELVEVLTRLMLGGLLPGLVLLVSNWWRFGSPFDTGYPAFEQDFPVVSGVWNQLASPGKGLVLYAPVVLVVGAGALWHLWVRRGDRAVSWERGLVAALIATNLVVFARVAFWSGDAAWGPRYVQIVLPCIVLLAAPLLDHDGWWRAIRVSSVVGFVIGGLLGVLVYFNVYYQDAYEALGGEPVAAEGGWPRALVAVSHEWAWQPQRGHLFLLGGAWRDVVNEGSPRPSYSSDPSSHYGYFGSVPRVDLWWLWVGPTHGSDATYLLAIPMLAAGVLGTRWIRPSRDAGSMLGLACGTRTGCSARTGTARARPARGQPR